MVWPIVLVMGFEGEKDGKEITDCQILSTFMVLDYLSRGVNYLPHAGNGPPCLEEVGWRMGDYIRMISLVLS